jgi:hypothetical protein
MQVELVSPIHVIGVNENKVTLAVKVEGLAVPALDVWISVASAAVVTVRGGVDSPYTFPAFIVATRAVVLPVPRATMSVFLTDGMIIIPETFGVRATSVVPVAILHQELRNTTDRDPLAMRVAIASLVNLVRLMKTLVQDAGVFILFTRVSNSLGRSHDAVILAVVDLHTDVVVAGTTSA